MGSLRPFLQDLVHVFISVNPVYISWDIVLDEADDGLVSLHVQRFTLGDSLIEHYNKKDLDAPILVLLLICLELVKVSLRLSVAGLLVD